MGGSAGGWIAQDHLYPGCSQAPHHSCPHGSCPVTWSIPLSPPVPMQPHGHSGSAGWCLCSPGALPAGTYRHCMQGVAQAELTTSHHGLLGGPAIAADRAPLTASLHLHAALKLRPPASQADLWGSPGAVSGHPTLCHLLLPNHPPSPSIPGPHPREQWWWWLLLPWPSWCGHLLVSRG